MLLLSVTYVRGLDQSSATQSMLSVGRTGFKKSLVGLTQFYHGFPCSERFDITIVTSRPEAK
jgi:hypothetical protein